MKCGTLLALDREPFSLRFPSPHSAAPRRIMPCVRGNLQPEASCRFIQIYRVGKQ
jgi:hypothetical protein